jgi:uncharacterized protein
VLVTATDADERIALIDALRGFALIGVLAANLPVMSGAAFLSSPQAAALPTAGADHVAERFVSFMIDGKFVTLFSFLFGVGFAMQLERARRVGAGVRRYVQRLAVMLGLGAVHGILIWYGDILTLYALLGFLLLLFRNAKDRTVLIWGLSLECVRFLVGLAYWLIGRHFRSTVFDHLADRIFCGSWPIVLHTQARAYLAINVGSPMVTVWYAPLLGNMLLGFWVGRKGLLRDPVAHAAFFRKLFWVALPLALVGAAGMVVFLIRTAGHSMHGPPRSFDWLMQLLRGAGELEQLALAAVYLAGIALLWRRPSVRRALDRLVPVGRMCVTNYLMQSVICTLVFYPCYVLGAGGGMGYLGVLGFAAGLYTVQAIVSRTWLQHFRFGPVEWLWRSLTYGRRQPMKRSVA